MSWWSGSKFVKNLAHFFFTFYQYFCIFCGWEAILYKSSALAEEAALILPAGSDSRPTRGKMAQVEQKTFTTFRFCNFFQKYLFIYIRLTSRPGKMGQVGRKLLTTFNFHHFFRKPNLNILAGRQVKLFCHFDF